MRLLQFLVASPRYPLLWEEFDSTAGAVPAESVPLVLFAGRRDTPVRAHLRDGHEALHAGQQAEPRPSRAGQVRKVRDGSHGVVQPVTYPRTCFQSALFKALPATPAASVLSWRGLLQQHGGCRGFLS